MIFRFCVSDIWKEDYRLHPFVFPERHCTHFPNKQRGFDWIGGSGQKVDGKEIRDYSWIPLIPVRTNEFHGSGFITLPSEHYKENQLRDHFENVPFDAYKRTILLLYIWANYNVVVPTKQTISILISGYKNCEHDFYISYFNRRTELYKKKYLPVSSESLWDTSVAENG